MFLRVGENGLDLVRLRKLCELCSRKIHKRMQYAYDVHTCGEVAYSHSLCTVAIGDRRKGDIPPAELPVLTNPGGRERESDVINSSTQNAVLNNTAAQNRKNVLISTLVAFSYEIMKAEN
ncbi:hypothetical protein TNIN_331201 [Trichonephila inaurata madagascariensis]|uniref:Uncharacterized protein n=1 Tax=Trichonephila inaurata madagascariensis TaxID=2747483 RepID=A0A8X6IWI5_9ARAC|nr:hypothetical protein TNIN_331201 [Trichonephila inaurata madagascariensis]